MKRKEKRAKFEKNRLSKLMKFKSKKKNGTIKQANKYKKRKIYIPNKVINLLESKNFQEAIKFTYGSVIISIPKEFSLITNPDQSIQTLMQIYYAVMNINVHEIYLDYSQCEVLGLCASSVTDIIVLNGIQYRKIKNSKINAKGSFPKTEDAKEIFIVSGLVKHLGLSKIEKKEVTRLDIIKNEEQGILCEKVIEYYDRCLNTQTYQLTDEGKNKLSQMIGEVIDNVGQHAGKLATWYAAGHFNLEKNEAYGKCRLVLFDFGDSIYESLNNSETTQYTKRLLIEKTKQHRSFFNNKWTEEALWTLYTLQYNVSRKRTSLSGDRGKGTIKLINNFMKIGKNNEGREPLMAILSGRSYILFDGTYKLKEEVIENCKIPVIAFNEENDLNKRPDPQYVKRITKSFPGTMISMEFYLDKQYIQAQMEGKNEQ